MSQIKPQLSPTTVLPDRSFEPGAGRWLQPVSRGIALFLGLVFLLNVLGELRNKYYRPDAWWIQFVVPAIVEEMGCLAAGGLLIAYAVAPPANWGRRRATRIAIELLSVFIAFNVVNFYAALIRGTAHSSFPIPFSLLVGGGLWIVWWGVGMTRSPRRAMDWSIIIFTVLVAAIVTPVLEMLCFGLTEYKDKADVAVVFAAPLLPDGQPSPAMKARVQRAVQLFKEQRVATLYVSGAAGVGQLDEAHAMRTLARDAGVPIEDIAVQAHSDSPEDIVRDVTNKFPDIPKLVVLSEFDQLPRIHMLFSQEEGWQAAVETAPAGPAVEGTFKAICSEIIPFWETSFAAITH